MLALGEELVTRGHEVYVPMCTCYPSPVNSTKRLPSSSVSELDYYVSQETVESLMKESHVDMSTKSVTEMIAIAQHLISQNVKYVLDDVNFMTQARSKNFDLAVVDSFPLAPYWFIIAHALNIPYVSMGAQTYPYMGGSPLLPSLHSNALLQGMHVSSFKYRLFNSLSQTFISIATKLHLLPNVGQFLLDKHASSVTSWQEIVDKSKMFFVTREVLMDYPQPYFPNVIAVPSLTRTPPKPLSSEFDQLVSSANEGIIVMSFGSMTQMISAEATKKILVVFKQLRQTIIWKTDQIKDDVSKELTNNIKIFSWIPQNDLLANEKTKLFITHGGLNSVYESLYNGVPMVGFPLFGDQGFNVGLIDERRYGIGLDINSFTTEELLQAVNEILSNNEYSKNVKKASAILNDHPMTPRQTVSYWIEHVMKFGHDHLRSHAMELNWYEYFSIDVLLCLSTVLSICVAATIWSIKSCYRCVCRKSSQ